MICNVCGNQEATVHLTEIVNSQMLEIHLCENCAQEKGTDFKNHFNFEDLLTGLGGSNEQNEASVEQELGCKHCGTNYQTFAKSGRLGCEHCYQAFAKMLGPLVSRVQRSNQHVGKKPSRISQDVQVSSDLKKLQDQLRTCIASEEFEEAAQLRDQIKKFLDKHKSKE